LNTSIRKIKADDQIELYNSIAEVWSVITDISSYYKWWPKVVSINISNFNKSILGTEFEVKPLNGQSFSCRIESIIPKEEIKINYFDGLYRGEAKWRLVENKNSTTVSYQVDLIIVNKLIIVLSYFLPISKIHSLIFQKIFLGLQRFLADRHH